MEPEPIDVTCPQCWDKKEWFAYRAGLAMIAGETKDMLGQRLQGMMSNSNEIKDTLEDLRRIAGKIATKKKGDADPDDSVDLMDKLIDLVDYADNILTSESEQLTDRLRQFENYQVSMSRITGFPEWKPHTDIKILLQWLLSRLEGVEGVQIETTYPNQELVGYILGPQLLRVVRGFVLEAVKQARFVVNPRVVITVSKREGEMVEIRIEDNGMTLSHEARKSWAAPTEGHLSATRHPYFYAVIPARLGGRYQILPGKNGIGNTWCLTVSLGSGLKLSEGT